MDLTNDDTLLDEVLNDTRGGFAMNVDGDANAEDEVVAEIDVVLSQELMDQLYVMQYPLRPLWRAYDNSQLESVRFKQGQQILEMEYGLKPEDRVREVQTKITSASTGLEYEDPTKSMQTHVVRSTVVPNKSNYLVGLYRGDELHVVPLKGVMQMRPSFAYIDQSAEKKKLMAAGEASADKSAAGIRASMDAMASSGDPSAGASGDMKTENDPTASAELKPVQFQVKKRETEKAVQNRLKSYAYLKQLEAEESFVKLDFVHRDRMDAMAEFEKIASRVRSRVPAPSMSQEAFLHAINPPLAEDGSPLTAEQIEAYNKEPRTTYARAELAEQKSRRIVPNQPPVVISHHTLSQLAPKEQLAHLFNNANVLTWSQICEYTTITDHAVLFTNLELNAILVQGVWVVRTEKSYRHRAANVRNWYLCKVALADPSEYENWYTSKQQIAETCGISVDMAATILDPITTLVPGFGLQLKYAPDESFISSYPDKVAKYKNLWDKSQEVANRDMKRWLTPSTVAASTAATSTSQASSKTSAPLSKPSVVSAKAAAAAAAASSTSISAATLAPTSVPASAAMKLLKPVIIPGATATGDAVMAVESSFNIGEMAESDSLGSLARIDLSVLAENQIKSLINAAISTYGVISPKGLVTFAQKNPKSVSEVEGGVTEDLALQELSKNAQKFKGVFIALPGSDPTYESWRDIVLDLFRNSPTGSILRQDVGAAFRTHRGRDAPRLMYSRIVSELVIVKSSTWHLKSGDASLDERTTV